VGAWAHIFPLGPGALLFVSLHAAKTPSSGLLRPRTNNCGLSQEFFFFPISSSFTIIGNCYWDSSGYSYCTKLMNTVMQNIKNIFYNHQRSKNCLFAGSRFKSRKSKVKGRRSEKRFQVLFQVSGSRSYKIDFRTFLHPYLILSIPSFCCAHPNQGKCVF
jgi:hypothetical protein